MDKLLESTLRDVIEAYLSEQEDGLRKRELYFYAKHLGFVVPEGKVVRVTLDLVSEAKLNNVPE